MVSAKIKSFQSVDIENLYTFIPENPTNFSFLLELSIGPNNEEGEELFDVQVCTPSWLISIMHKDDILICRHMIIVQEYNFDKLFNRIKTLIESCMGNTWKEVAEKVARYGHWEFEDYNENNPLEN
jgi:hypothetical protein